MGEGWETRRRRGVSAEQPWPTEEDHDWALIRLGAPGVIRGIVVDTAHFRGNYPQAVSVEGASVAGSPSPEELLADDEATTRTPHPKLRIARAREVPDNFLDELLPWLMQHRVLSDDEVRRDLRRWVPEYQTAVAPVLQSVPSVRVASNG